MITYEQRVTNIKTVDDVSVQIRLAKAYMMRLRAEAKKKPTLAEKLATQEQAKKAESVLRRLRFNVFDLEDMAKNAAH